MNLQLVALEKQFAPSVLTQIHTPLLHVKKIELWIKRDDLLHPVISGNKWRKLKYPLNQALSLNKTTLISMGGAYSNHLHALAFVGKQLNLKTKAFVRGERPAVLNPTLHDLLAWGMTLEFVSRSVYRELRTLHSADELPATKSEDYWIPEGGATPLALQGVAHIVDEITQEYDVLCTACGTGTTLAGLVQNLPTTRTVLGFSALKGGDFLTQDVKKLLHQTASTPENWCIQLDYHFGGFGKTTPQLIEFIDNFASQHGVMLEPVYTGKMLFGLFDLIAQDYFSAGQKIIALHTGGLQGNRPL